MHHAVDSVDREDSGTWAPTGEITVGVVGQGIVGKLTARLVSSANISVVGYDCDPVRVACLQADAQLDPHWTIVADSSQLATADVIVIAVRISAVPEKLDLTAIEQACRAVAALPKRTRLVLVETTLPPGVTRRLSREILNPDGDDTIQVAYCPERLKVGDSEAEVRRTPRLAAGLTPAATRSAVVFLRRLGIEAIPVSAPEVAELSKLLENAFLTTGISLMGEITRISHSLGISAHEVASVAATKPLGYFPFWPGAGIGGHCLINDLKLLAKTSSGLGLDTPLIEALEHSRRGLSPSVIDYLEAIMAERHLALERSRVWIIGVGFKIGSGDTSRSPAVDCIRILRDKNVEVLYSDSQVEQFEVDDAPVARVSNDSWPTDMSASLILAGDAAIDLSRLKHHVPVVLDAGGTRIMPGSAEGIYRL